MPRELTGGVEYVPPGPGEPLGNYRYRISLVDGSRPWIDVAPTVRSKDAEARVREVAAERSKTAREKGRSVSGFEPIPRRTLKDVQGGREQRIVYASPVQDLTECPLGKCRALALSSPARSGGRHGPFSIRSGTRSRVHVAGATVAYYRRASNAREIEPRSP